ncbi:MAG TPA: hypothetical protein VKC65_07930 [Gaiellaceae bacterium]|nr:hypothetical protein [Gaiellaceae bacterium]
MTRLPGILQSNPMAALDTNPRTRTPADHPVFVAGDGRRARRLRNAAIVVGVVAALWLVGLGVGMVGLGSLPGIGLVKGARVDSRLAEVPSALAAKVEGERPLPVTAHATSIRRQSTRSATARRAASRAAARHSRKAKRASRPPAVVPPPTDAQAPANPARRTRGWARRGYAAPRGQLRRGAPPPAPPVTSRGRRVGQTPPATPPPAPAGQAKKAAEPPPPPPPPKKV